jgi:hypothetical protein
VARQGYLPDLRPLLDADQRARLLVPRSFSSPVLSVPLNFADGHTSSSLAVKLLPQSQQAPEDSEAQGQGSMAGTVFNLMSSTLGAGALSLPLAISQFGALLGPILLIITACATHYSIDLLVSALITTGARSYEELTVSVFGKRMGLLVELNIIVFCFGTVIAYTVAVGDILKPLIKVPGRAQQPHLSHAHTSFDELIPQGPGTVS